MESNQFILYGCAANPAGQWEQVCNLREWLPQGSRSISDRFTGVIYGRGPKGFRAAQADSERLNRETRRPVLASHT